MEDHRGLIVWAEPDQAAHVQATVGATGLTLAGVGSSTAAAAATLAERLGTPRVADLRVALQPGDVHVVWLASPHPLDADERRALRETSVRCVTSEPQAAGIANVLSSPEELALTRFIPRMRQSPGFRSALDALDDFGPRRLVSVVTGAGPGEGTLFARLFDAMDLLEFLCGSAEGIDAALAGRLPAVPESLPELTGWMSVNLRYAENCCAVVAATDRAGAWTRRVTIIGEDRILRIDDAGWEERALDAEPLGGNESSTPLTCPALIAEEIARIAADRDPSSTPRPDTARLLALCETARLSCRTGQGEAPRRLLAMQGRP